MPDFTLKDYVALREAVEALECIGHEGAVLDRARDALHALRKFFPSFDLWEREQAARLTP